VTVGAGWPLSEAALREEQEALARRAAEALEWSPLDPGALRVAGVFVVYRRGLGGPGAAGDPAWIGAAMVSGGRMVASATAPGRAGAPYVAGLLALREGALLEAGVRGLGEAPDVVLVDASGRDHPRGAGLALHLGARLGVPTIGVTDRPLLAAGPEPPDAAGAWTELRLGGEAVALRLRTRAGTRPVIVHAAWGTSLATARRVVLAVTLGERTPAPLREARRLARTLRSEEGEEGSPGIEPGAASVDRDHHRGDSRT
jgi:deoxyribonuclease V